MLRAPKHLLSNESGATIRILETVTPYQHGQIFYIGRKICEDKRIDTMSVKPIPARNFEPIESGAGRNVPSRTGRQGTLQRTWHRMALPLVCAGSLLGLAGEAFTAGGFFSRKPISPSAQLLCAGTVRYQFGKNAWNSRVDSNIPVVLPISIQTEKDPSQLIVPKMGVFQANANTHFTLDMDKDRRFQLTINQGAVFYSVTKGESMRITSPLPGVGANVTGPEDGQSSGIWSAIPADQFVGQTVFEKNNNFQLVNMNGRAQVDRNGRTVRNVGQGHTLFISLPDQATTGTATMPPHDQTRVYFPGESGQPQCRRDAAPDGR